MSEFVSLCDVIFGRLDEKGDSGSAIKIEAVPLVAVVSAIESTITDAYCFDDFGRFSIAKEDMKAKALTYLSDYHNVLIQSHPYDIGQYEMQIEEMIGETMWHRFGWSLSKLPEFIKLHKAWVKANGNLTEFNLNQIIPPNDAPAEPKRNTNSVWQLANVTLRIAIGDYLEGKGNVDEFISELMSSEYTHKINDLWVHLECKGLDMDITVFREKLKSIFWKK